MKLHYFDQDSADADDMMLGMAKMQGYVPAKCLLYGMDVIESPLVQPQPNFRINPDLPMTDGGRRKAQDWCKVTAKPNQSQSTSVTA